MAASYVNAGSNVILSNTFSANIFTLDKHGYGGKVEAFNEAGTAISKQAAANKAWVFASMGPSGKMLVADEVTEEELYKAFPRKPRRWPRAGRMRSSARPSPTCRNCCWRYGRSKRQDCQSLRA